jgi:xylulose-5-phosphate/fructose-6-phosphate phosphoketolase
VIERVGLGSAAAYAKQAIRDKRIEHKEYIRKHGEDMAEIRNWKWDAGKSFLGKTWPATNATD